MALMAQSEVATLQPTITQIGQYWDPAKAFGTGLINGEITSSNMKEGLDKMVEGILSSLN